MQYDSALIPVMTPLLELIDVSKAYLQGDVLRVVLDQVSARVENGEAVAVRGRSGSGKTTLLNLIAGLDAADHGRIMIGGRDLQEMTERERTLYRRRNIGIVFQFFNLIPTLTVEENIRLPLELNGASGRVGGHPDPAELLERTGLLERGSDYPDELSGGEQQRVAIARVLVHRPRIVLADEPTGNLDAETGDAVIELLCELTRELGGTLILVTHSRTLAGIADRILTIQHGRLALE